MRPTSDADLPFLRDLYASTRYEELAPAGWTPAEVDAFLSDQFRLQHIYYAEHYPDADYSLLLDGDRPIGRIYIDRREDELRLMEIALLPEYRGRGIGSTLIEGVLAEATQAGLPVRLHVEKFNRVRDYYLRLGFVVIDDRGVYDFMEWLPPDGDAQENAAS